MCYVLLTRFPAALYVFWCWVLAPSFFCGCRRSPSELNPPTVASKRSASFFFKAKIGVFVICVLFGGQSRTESSPWVPCALRPALFLRL
jgi:hypothetical protein